MAHIFWNENTL